jgi:hypothetical protein
MFLALTPSCLALDLQGGFILNIEEIWIDFNKNGVLRLMKKVSGSSSSSANLSTPSQYLLLHYQV